MTDALSLRKDFDKVVTTHGNHVRIKYYSTTSSGGTYDDEVYLAKSGSDVWCWGRQNYITSATGGNDRKLLMAGAVTFGDSVLYLPGSIAGFNENTKFGIGSPIIAEYAMVVDAGNIPYTLGSTVVYNKVYVRVIPTGSFINEI